MLYGISDLGEWYKIYWKQYKCKLHLAKYSNCKIQVSHNTDVIPITNLSNILSVTMLASPATRKEHLDWNQLKPIAIALFKMLLLVV